MCGDAGGKRWPWEGESPGQRCFRAAGGCSSTAPQPPLPLTFQPGAPGPSSALQRSGRWVMAWGCPTGLGGLAVRKSLEAALGQRSPSPCHEQRRGQIQSRARSTSARHGVQGCDGTAVPRAGTTSARAEAVVRASRFPASQPPHPPRTHPRGPRALGAANWAPPSPALALKKPHRCQGSPPLGYLEPPPRLRYPAMRTGLPRGRESPRALWHSPPSRTHWCLGSRR